MPALILGYLLCVAGLQLAGAPERPKKSVPVRKRPKVDDPWGGKYEVIDDAAPKKMPKAMKEQEITCLVTDAESKNDLYRLRWRLQEEIKNITNKYHVADLEAFVRFPPDKRTALSRAMTLAYMGKRKFTIGVTGGVASAYAGNVAWTQRLLDWFVKIELENVELRNAAQKDATTFSTSTCLRQMVGDKVDLLMWEFAIDEEPIARKIGKRNNVAQTVEAYVRSSLQDVKPKAMGFLHFWDQKITKGTLPAYSTDPAEREKGIADLPERYWNGTNGVLSEYDDFSDNFGVNVMRMLYMLDLYNGTDGNVFLLDQMLPNAFGFEVATDLLIYGLAKMWMDGLKGLGKCPMEERQLSPFKASFPVTYNNKILPRAGITSHCFNFQKPQFAKTSQIQLVCARGSIFAENATYPQSGAFIDCDPETLDAKGVDLDGNRTHETRRDRHFTLVPGICRNGQYEGGITFNVNITTIDTILMDCGTDRQCDQLFVFLNGHPLIGNLMMKWDYVAGFFAWGHKHDHSSHRKSSYDYQTLHICRKDNPNEVEPRIGRIVFLEKVA